MATQTFSTYALIIIGLSEGLSKSILNSSDQTKAKHTSVLPITMLEDSQVKQAIFHPHNKALDTLRTTAFVNFAKARKKINSEQISVNEQRLFIDETIRWFADKEKNATDAFKTQIKVTRNALVDQYKILNHIQNAATHGEKQIIEIDQAIDKFTEKHDELWSKYREEQLKQLSSEVQRVVAEAKLHSIPQAEIDNLLLQDLQYLLDRFKDSGADKALPKNELDRILALNNLDFDTYFRMKAYMAIRSVATLGEQSKIVPAMEKLESFFNQAKESGNKIYQQQESEINTLNERVQPILKVAADNNKTLETLKDAREKLLENITSEQELQSIQQKIQSRSEEATRTTEPTTPGMNVP